MLPLFLCAGLFKVQAVSPLRRVFASITECVKTDGRFCLHLTQGRNLSIHAGLERAEKTRHIFRNRSDIF